MEVVRFQAPTWDPPLQEICRVGSRGGRFFPGVGGKGPPAFVLKHQHLSKQTAQAYASIRLQLKNIGDFATPSSRRGLFHSNIEVNPYFGYSHPKLRKHGARLIQNWPLSSGAAFLLNRCAACRTRVYSPALRHSRIP